MASVCPENVGVPTPRRLLAVHAHPDDEASKGAATTARYAAAGVEVLVVTCTGGERGDVLNPALDRPEITESLPSVRRAEMAEAASILGVRHAWLGFIDSGWSDATPAAPPPAGSFADVPMEEPALSLLRIVRAFRPHVLTTYDENGGYPHPDHLRTHEISRYVWEHAGDRSRHPAAGPAWTPLKLYYHHSFHRERLMALHEAVIATGQPSPYAEWLADRADDSHRVTTRVRCAEYFPVRERALLAHATQVPPTSAWFTVPAHVQAEIWPTEDYELAATRVPVSLPEDDLFAGVPDDIA